MPKGAVERKGYMKGLNNSNEGKTANAPSMVAAWHSCHVLKSSKVPTSKISITAEGDQVSRDLLVTSEVAK